MSDDKKDPKTPEEVMEMIRDPKTEIRFAATENIESYDEEVQFILDRLAEFWKRPKLANAWVSDQSYIMDLSPDLGVEADYEGISRAIGVAVERNTPIWEVAKRIREKRTAGSN